MVSVFSVVRQQGQGYGEYLLCGQAARTGIWLVSSLWSGSKDRDMVSIFSVVRQQGQGYGEYLLCGQAAGAGIW